MRSTYHEPGIARSEDAFLRIDKFFWHKDLDQWRIRIVNDTDFYYHNVSIFKVETKEEICHFSVVQPHCKLWKETGIPYSEDLYGLHLIAISQDQIVMKDPFLITPCKLMYYNEPGLDIVQGDDPEENAGGVYEGIYELVLKNYSLKQFENLRLARPDQHQATEFPDQSFEYGDKVEVAIKVKFDFNTNPEIYENFKIFAFSGDEKISWDLWLYCDQGKNE